jgi:hypothetical protein
MASKPVHDRPTLLPLLTSETGTCNGFHAFTARESLTVLGGCLDLAGSGVIDMTEALQRRHQKWLPPPSARAKKKLAGPSAHWTEFGVCLRQSKPRPSPRLACSPQNQRVQGLRTPA